MKKLIKKYAGNIVLSSAVILVASLAGGNGLVWPVFILLGLHLICLLITFYDQRNRVQSRKAMDLLFWIVPVISVITAITSRLADNGGHAVDLIPLVTNCGLGLLFLVIGNYMPKFRQNKTMGIRVKWTLENEENWVMTHRFAGKLFMIAGFCCIVISFLPLGTVGEILCLLVILIAAFLPCFYSWRYYKQQLKDGKAEKRFISRKAWIGGGIFAVVLVIFLIWVLFAGSMNVVYQDTSFTVETSYWKDLTIPYEEITSVEYLPQDPSKEIADMRTNGFGNLTLGMGTFQNDLYGTYTRYTYSSCPSCVVLTTVDERNIVLNGKDDTATEEIYERLNIEANR